MARRVRFLGAAFVVGWLAFLLLSFAPSGEAVTLVISNVPPEFSSAEIFARNGSLVVELRVSDYNGWRDLYRITVNASGRDGSLLASAVLELYESNTSIVRTDLFSNEVGEALNIAASWVSYSNESLTVVERTTLTAAFELAPISARWLEVTAEDRGGLVAQLRVEYPGELLGVLHPVPDLVPLVLGLVSAGLLVRQRWIQLRLGGWEGEEPPEAEEEPTSEPEAPLAPEPARWSQALDLVRFGGFSLGLFGFLAGFTLVKSLLLLFRAALETPGWAAALTPLYESDLAFEPLLFLGFLVAAAGVFCRFPPTPSRLQLGLILAFVSLYGLMLALTGPPPLGAGDELAAVALVLLLLATMPLDHAWSLRLIRPVPSEAPAEEEELVTAPELEGPAEFEEAEGIPEALEEPGPLIPETAEVRPSPAPLGAPTWEAPPGEEWRPSPVLEGIEEVKEVPEEPMIAPPEPVLAPPEAPPELPAEPPPEAPPLPEELAVAALETEAKSELLPHIYLLGCPFCGYLLSSLDARCERCGFELTRWTRLECPICGDLLAPEQPRCPNCGVDLDAFAEQVAETYNTAAVRATLLEGPEAAPPEAAPTAIRGLRCPFCGAAIAGEEESCPSCNVHFLPEMFVTCTDCGARFLREQPRCDICGAPSAKPRRPGPVEIVKEVTRAQRAKVKLKRRAEVRRKQIKVVSKPGPPRARPRVATKMVAKPAPRRAPPAPPPPPPPTRGEKKRRRFLRRRNKGK